MAFNPTDDGFDPKEYAKEFVASLKSPSGSRDKKSPISPDALPTKITRPGIEDDNTFRGFFTKQGFEVNRTYGRAINPGSPHPIGGAADLSIRGKSPDDIFRVMESSLKKGYRVFDEREVAPGVKQTGPHIHVENGKTSLRKPSRFIAKGLSSEQVTYLKGLDDVRRGSKSDNSASATFDPKAYAKEFVKTLPDTTFDPQAYAQDFVQSLPINDVGIATDPDTPPTSVPPTNPVNVMPAPRGALPPVVPQLGEPVDHRTFGIPVRGTPPVATMPRKVVQPQTAPNFATSEPAVSDINYDDQGNPISVDRTSNLRTEEVSRQDAGATGGFRVDFPQTIKTPQAADKYVRTQLKAQYGDINIPDNFTAINYQPGQAGVVISYDDLKKMGVDTDTEISQKIAEHRVENPISNLYVGRKWSEDDAAWLNSNAGQILTTINPLAAFLPKDVRNNVGASLVGGWAGGSARMIETVAGIARPLNTDLYTALKDAARPSNQLFQQTGTNDITSQVFKTVGGAPVDFSRIYVLSRLPGGVTVGMGLDMGLQSAGRGESHRNIALNTARGVATGAVFELAPFVGAATAGMTRKIIPASVGTLGTIVLGTAKVGSLFGDSDEQALQNGILNGLFHLMNAGMVSLGGKTVRAYDKSGKTVDVEVTPKGEVKLLKGQVEKPDIEMYVPEAVKSQSVEKTVSNAQPVSPEVLKANADKFIPKITPEDIAPPVPAPIEALPAVEKASGSPLVKKQNPTQGVVPTPAVDSTPVEGVKKSDVEATPSNKPADVAPSIAEADDYQVYSKTFSDGQTWYGFKDPKGAADGAGNQLVSTKEDAQRSADVAKANAEFRAKAAEAENAKKAVAEQAKQERGNLNGFDAQMTPMRRGKVQQVLDKKWNFGKAGVKTAKQFIEDAVADGSIELTTEEVNRIKDMSRMAEFRATGEQQRAHEQRVKEGGKVTQYLVNGLDLGKTAYDYATFLLNETDFGNIRQSVENKGQSHTSKEASDDAFVQAHKRERQRLMRRQSQANAEYAKNPSDETYRKLEEADRDLAAFNSTKWVGNETEFVTKPQSVETKEESRKPADVRGEGVEAKESIAKSTAKRGRSQKVTSPTAPASNPLVKKGGKKSATVTINATQLTDGTRTGTLETINGKQRVRVTPNTTGMTGTTKYDESRWKRVKQDASKPPTFEDGAAVRLRNGDDATTVGESFIDEHDVERVNLITGTTPMPKVRVDTLQMAVPQHTINASGESSASQEAINRLNSERGMQRVVVDTRSKAERPLIGVDAVDYVPRPSESVEWRGGNRNGEVIAQGNSVSPSYRPPMRSEVRKSPTDDQVAELKRHAETDEFTDEELAQVNPQVDGDFVTLDYVGNEIIRRAGDYINTGEKTNEIMAGRPMLKKAEVNAHIDMLHDAAEQGNAAEKLAFTKLADALTEARDNGDGRIGVGIEVAKTHEKRHLADERASEYYDPREGYVVRDFAKRAGSALEKVADESTPAGQAFKQFSDVYNKMRPGTSVAVRVAEVIGHAEDLTAPVDKGGFGLTKKQSASLLRVIIEGRVEAAGGDVKVLRHFEADNSPLYKAIQGLTNENSKRESQKLQRGDEGSVVSGSEREAQLETAPEEVGADVGTDGKGASESFKPSGEERLSQTPETLRETGLNVEDRSYTSTFDAERIEFANSILDKGVDGANDWLNRQIEDNNRNAGATVAVGVNLMSHYNRTGEVDELNKVAKILVPQLTDAAQMLQFMRTVSQADPKSAAGYAAILKERRTGKGLTPAQSKRATDIATKLDGTAKAAAVLDAAEMDANRFIKELQTEIDAINAELEAVTQRVKLQDAEIEQLKSHKGGKKVSGEKILSREAEIMAALKKAFPGAANLRMAVAKELSPEDRKLLVDYASLSILKSKPYTDLLGELHDLTGLGAEAVKTIHAEAIESIKGESPRANMTAEKIAEVRAKAKIRSEHKAEAKRFRGNSNLKISKLELEITDSALDDPTRLGALILSRTSDVDDWHRIIGNEYPDLTKTELRDLYKRSTDLKNASKIELRRRAASNSRGIELTLEDMENLKEQRRVNNHEAAMGQGDADRFYASIVRGPWQIAADTTVDFMRANPLVSATVNLGNLLGNTGFVSSEEAFRPISATVDHVVSKFTGDVTVAGINGRRVSKGFWAIFKSPKELEKLDKHSGLIIAKNIWKYGAGAEEMKLHQHRESNMAEVFLEGRKHQVATMYDWYINHAFRTLEAGDAIFKAYAYMNSMFEQSIAIAKTEANRQGLKGQERKDFIATRRKELFNDPSMVMDRVAQDFAVFMTFQDDNMLSRLWAMVKGKHPVLQFVGDAVVLYDRTPSNIVIRMVEHLPVVGAVMTVARGIAMKRAPSTEFKNRYRPAVEQDLRNTPDWDALPPPEQIKRITDGVKEQWSREKQQKFARTFGRASAGQFLFALGGVLAAYKLLTGTMSPEDKDKLETDEFYGIRRKQGIENRSLLIPGVGRFVLPSDPASKTLSAGATFYEQYQMANGNSAVKTWEASKEVLFDVLSEQPLMSSPGQLFKQLQQGKYGEIAGGFTAGRVTPSILTQVGEVFDEKSRTASGLKEKGQDETIEGKLRYQWRGFRNSSLRRIPFWRTWADESTTDVSPEERGPWWRRAIRGVDPFRTRSPREYNPPVFGAQQKGKTRAELEAEQRSSGQPAGKTRQQLMDEQRK